MADNNSKRDLANADQETRERVAREGGKASHAGFRNMDRKEQEEIARKCGKSSHGG